MVEVLMVERSRRVCGREGLVCLESLGDGREDTEGTRRQPGEDFGSGETCSLAFSSIEHIVCKVGAQMSNERIN